MHIQGQGHFLNDFGPRSLHIKINNCLKDLSLIYVIMLVSGLRYKGNNFRGHILKLILFCFSGSQQFEDGIV